MQIVFKKGIQSLHYYKINKLMLNHFGEFLDKKQKK